MAWTLTQATHQGSRPTQEDRWVTSEIAAPRGWLVAVFDGHGGEEAVEACSAQLPGAFQRSIDSAADPTTALRDAIAELRASTELVTSGTVVAAAFVPEDGSNATVAQLGDCVVLIKRPTEPVWLAPLHHASANADDRQAAIDRGADYRGGYLHDAVTNRAIIVTRALGDADCSFLGREPEMFSIPLDSAGYVALGTDGLYSRSVDLEPGLTGLLEAGANADDLVEDALRRNTKDNVTAIVLCR